jgi:hypothetical protein
MLLAKLGKLVFDEGIKRPADAKGFAAEIDG